MAATPTATDDHEYDLVSSASDPEAASEDDGGLDSWTTFTIKEPLTMSIKGILRDYADSTQIARELLQNSDDARSTSQWYLLDHHDHRYHPEPASHEPGQRSQKSKRPLKLADPRMSEYMGPALLAGNDSLFEERDFESLQNLRNSGKKDDVLKTGQMGIGFNSVYHLTDCPSFISGDQLVIMEPHARILDGKKTRHYGSAMAPFSMAKKTIDQFKVFSALEEIDFSKHYQGTIFRIPLRTEEQAKKSDISSSACSTEKAMEMLMNLKSEAVRCLLFLKYVEKITIYERHSADKTPTRLFMIEIENAEEVRESRKQFLNQLRGHLDSESPSGTLDCSIRPKFKITEKDETVTYETWQVTSMVGNASQAREFMNHFKADIKRLRMIPWVGIASPVDPKKKIEKAELFCFQSLGMEIPVPVHIHGHFAVNQSRSGIYNNERGELSEGGEQSKLAHWNKYLIDKVIPVVYARFLENMGVDYDESYGLWPKPITSKQGSSMLRCLLSNVLEYICSTDNSAVFLCGKGGAKKARAFKNCWIAGADIKNYPLILDALHDLLDLTTDVPMSIVSVLRGIMESRGQSDRILSPSVVREILLHESNSSWQTSETVCDGTRVQMLNYCIEDGKILELEGLALLPMADGAWASFSEQDRCDRFVAPEPVYSLLEFSSNGLVNITMKDLPLHQFQENQEFKRFLSVMPSKDFAKRIFTVFKKKFYGTNDPTPGLINRTERGDFPSRQWIADFWHTFCNDETKYLHDALPQLKHLHLLLVTGDRLAPLDPERPVIDCRDPSVSAGEFLKEVKEMLEKRLLCPVLDVNVDFSVAKKYLVKLEDVSNVLKILAAVDMKVLEKLSQQDRETLCKFLANGLASSSRNLSSEKVNALKILPIYRGFINTDLQSLVSFQHPHICNGFTADRLRWKLPTIDLLQENQLMQWVLKSVLCIPFISETEYWFRLLERLDEYPIDQWDDMIVAFCHKFYEHNCNKEFDFAALLRERAFVTAACPNPQVDNSAGERIYPCRAVATTLARFYMENEVVFPAGVYAREPVVSVLKVLGMKTLFNAKFVVERIKTLSASVASGTDVALAFEPLKALSTHLQAEFRIFERQMSGNSQMACNLQKTLRETRWIPGHVASNPSQVQLYTAEECCHSTYSNIVGDAMPISDFLLSDLALLKFLGWDRPPPLDPVLRHMLKVIEPHQAPESDFLSTKDDSTLHSIYAYLFNHLSAHPKSIPTVKSAVGDKKWILIEKKLHATDRVAFDLPVPLGNRIIKLPSSQLDTLFSVMGVRQSVNAQELEDIISSIGKQYQDTAASELRKGCLTESDSQLVLNILGCLSKSGYTWSPDLLILTKDAELCRVADVVYDDMNALQDSLAAMLDDGPRYTFASPSISSTLAAKLKIPRLKERFLQDRGDAMFEIWAQKENIVDRIKGILNDYDPESIFVEFLQNAEDAGATEFACMLDQREFDTEKLFCEEMAAWQGPALVFFNNAEFTEEDFKALSKLGVGGKRGDPSKIGRYGLGFNSVYHFTDVPSVLSGSHIGFFDPHRKYLPKNNTADGPVGRGGIRCNFQKLRLDKTFVDQAMPYKDLFGCNMVDHFKGTIFRIPLRTENSQSGFGRNWTIPRVQDMLRRWAEDAKVGTLFLEKIQTIKLEDGDYVKYSMTRTDVSENSGLSSILDKRTVPPSMNARIFSISSTTPSSSTEETRRWMVSTESEFLEDTPADIRALAIKNRWRPHCGIAFPLDPPHSFKGRVFSHVPTMIETELPFHIHGVFALLSNRKGLSGGQNAFEDDKTTWNMYVCHRLLPLCIVKALEVLLEFHFAEFYASKAKRQSHEVEIATHSYFKYWPPQRAIAHFDSQMLEAFWRLIHSHAVFPCLTKSDGSIIGKTGRATVFPDGDLLFPDGDFLSPIAQETNKLLRSAGVAICEHSHEIIGKVREAWAIEPALKFKQVNPKMLRMHMRQRPAFLAEEIKDNKSRTRLLEYLLAALLGSPDPYQSINGLGVIPLMNGEWKCLYNSPEYFIAPMRMQALLDAKDIFVNTDIFGTPKLRRILAVLQNDKRYGISKMEPEDFTRHFCAENEGVAITSEKHIQVWKYLAREANCQRDIANRCGKLPILKTMWGHFKPLEDYSMGLQISNHMDREVGILMPIFQHLRVPIFNPTQFQNHPKYVSGQSFNPLAVLTILGKNSSWADSVNITEDQATLLRKMIFSVGESLSPELAYQLGRLRIWKSHGMADPATEQRMVAAWEAYILSSDFPDVDGLGNYPDIIRNRNISLKAFGARILSLGLFAQDKVFPYLRRLTPHRLRQHHSAYVSLMRELFRLAKDSPPLLHLLKEGHVMMTREGSFRTCRELMDPDDDLLTTVFEGVRNMFPDERLWSVMRYVKSEYNLQLSTEPGVTTRCVLEVMERIAQDPLSTTVHNMAQKLVRHAYAHCNGKLSTVNWINPEWRFVPAELTSDSIQSTYAPDHHPSFMGFYELVSKAHRDVVWTQCAFFPDGLEPPSAFKTRYPAVGKPSAQNIVDHLCVLARDLAPKWKLVEHQLMLKSILFKVYQILDDYMGEPGHAALLSTILKSHLKDVAFILDDCNSDTALPESWSKPQDLMFGIRKQTKSHRTVSPWLLHYRRFLVAAGVMEISTPEGHEVDVPDGRTLGVLEKWLGDCFKAQDADIGCMDVKYIFSEEREILAHKVVLVHGSEFFKGKFTGPWGDVCATDGLKVVIDHSKNEGTEYGTKYEAFWGLLYYLYTDELILCNGPVDTRISSDTSVRPENAVGATSTDALKDKEVEERVERTIYLLDLLDMANMHGLERLKLMISSEIICNSFEHDLLPSVRYHAKKSGADKLVAYCDEFMKKNKNSLIPVYKSDIENLEKRLEKMYRQKEDGTVEKNEGEEEEEVQSELEEKKEALAELLAKR
ncbi:hypothetical protein BGZ51_006884 [Haplosporangium sp. Z 767]|nr:hypothetical protein BGZ51_006884 [Haplosporangium sp. Z 767]